MKRNYFRTRSIINKIRILHLLLALILMLSFICTPIIEASNAVFQSSLAQEAPEFVQELQMSETAEEEERKEELPLQGTGSEVQESTADKIETIPKAITEIKNEVTTGAAIDLAPEGTVNSLSTCSVTNLTAVPNNKDRSIILTWENPTENFSYAFIELWMDYGSESYWRYLGDTLDNSDNNTFTHSNVAFFTSYKYRVTAVDNNYNRDPNPPQVSAELSLSQPIMLLDWNLDNNGKIYSRNLNSYGIASRFIAAADIVSIEYMLSTDNVNWTAIDASMINNDYGLEFNQWDKYWTRYIYLDFTSYNYESFWIKATATDTNGATLTEVKELTKDLICENITDLTIAPNSENTALVLNWSVPADFAYCEIYKEYYYYGWKWGYEAKAEGTGYIDTEVDTANKYKIYRYKLVTYDKSGNESQNPLIISGNLATPGPIAFKDWFFSDKDKKINRYGSSNYTVSTSFYSLKPVSSIQYNYSLDGVTWRDLTPFISTDYGVQYDQGAGHYYHIIAMNIGPDSGIPDGNIHIQAICTDEEGNTLSREETLVKDATPPDTVTNITAVPNDDNTAIVLNWTNPVSDMAYIIIERNYSYITPANFNLDSYSDSNVKAGQKYTYKFIVYDAFGNKSELEPSVEALLPTSKPVLEEMTPVNNYLTKDNTLYYSATFRSDKTINRIVFEASSDGSTWIKLKDETPSLDYYGYELGGAWDISSILEEEWQLRATAYDTSGGTAAEIRTVMIDHKAPPVPSNFAITNTTVSPYTITFTWDAVEGANKYHIYKYYANPDDGSYPQGDTVYAPEHSYTFTYGLYAEVPYIFKVQAVDKAGNYSDNASIDFEFYTGPEVVLDNGYDVYTNNSNYILSGTTAPGTELTVDSNIVVVGADGKFSYNATLTQLNNTFNVVAKKDNIIHNVQQKVTYDTVKPTVSSFSPGDNSYLQGSRARIYISSSDNIYGNIKRQVLQVSKDDGATWIDILEIPYGQSEAYWDTTGNVGETGALADGAYKFRLMVWDKAGNSTDGNPVRIWKIDNTKPEPPTELTAVQQLGKIKLNWLASASADIKKDSMYRIYRSTDPDSIYTNIATTSSTSYEDSSISEGITYYYAITVLDLAGNESIYSNQASTSPLADTTAPVFTTVPSGDYPYGGPTLRLYVSATDDSPKGVEKFVMEYSGDGGISWKSSSSGANSRTGYDGKKEYYINYELSTSGMKSGSYIFRFSAIDYSKNAAVQERNFTLDLTVDAVQNLTVRSGDGEIILEWTKAEGSDIDNYTVMRSTYYSGGYYSIGTISDKTITSYADKTVGIGKTYYYKILTRDAFRNENLSGVVSAFAKDDMTAPVITAVNVNDSVTIGGKVISLIVSATDNKKPTSVEFLGSQDGGVTWKPLQAAFKNVYTRPDNITYDFYYEWTTSGFESGDILVKIIAKDAAGNEGIMEKTWKLDLFVTPPSNIRTTPGDGSILIEWDAVTDEDISAYAYDVLRSTKPGGPYELRQGSIGKTTPSYTDTGAQTGVTYYYVVRSRDNFGNESQSVEVEAAPAEDKIPPYIESVSPIIGATLGGPVSQQLYVYASDNAGMAGVSAKIEYSLEGDNWLPVNASIDGPLDYGSNKFYFKSSWNLYNLSTGNYKVRYTITDAAGNSTSQTADYFVDRTGPSSPQNLLATFGESSIGLVWELPPEIDTAKYNIYRSNTLDGAYELIKQIEGKDSNIYSDNTVQTGLTYFYKVCAIDKFNQEGTASNIASAAAIEDSFAPVVTLIEPEHHTVLGANAQITVKAEDNAALSSITLEYNNGSGWKAIGTIATIGTAVFNWSTKPLNGNVQVRAIAKDSAGNISDGVLYRAYIIDNTGPSIEGLKGTSFGGDIVLQWDGVPDQDLAYFLVEKKDDLGNYHEVKKLYNILGINIPNLEPATDYWFRVTAFDKLGNAGEPEEIMVNSGNDLTPPLVSYEYHNIYSGNASIVITAFTASDNVKVKKLKLQYSSDGISWTDILERTLEEPIREIRFNETWDVSALPDGDYYVRAFAEDEAGNVSQPSQEVTYNVDHIKPVAPETPTLSSTGGYMDLKWKYPTTYDFWGFELWRSEAEEGPYENIVPDKYSYMGFRDRNIERGKTYYYKVTAVDAAGNKSEFSGITAGSLTADTNPPYIYLIDPLEGDILNSRTEFIIRFTDDLALDNMKIEYQQDTSEGNEWALMRSRNYNSDGMGKINSAEEAFYWDNTGLPEGWYKVSVTVTDSTGNTTGPLIMRYLVKNIAPGQPVLTCAPGGWQVNLSWNPVNQEEDFSNYTIYRSEVLGGTFRQVQRTAENTFVDNGVQPGIRYYYYIRAYDIYGNYSQSETVSVVPTNEDKILPVADAGDDLILTVGMEAYFDGTLSKDNDRIASYLWDFGDGNTGVTAQPNYSYSKEGNYIATLKVTDPAGNTSSDTITVKVVSVDEVGVLEVKVVDDVTGQLLPGSSVVIDYPDGATWKTSTNNVGTAFVVAPPGDYEVFAYKTDFRPASMKVTMVRGQKNTVMIRLPKGSVVTGELKATRMNLDEIIAAGIDITNPANQYAYKFEIGLGFNLPDIPIIVTKERIIRPPNVPYDFVTISDDGNRIIIREKEEDGDGDGNIFYGERLILPEDVPAMAYMVIPGKTTWLKEFFDIGFTIQNAADPEFVIENAWAKLTIPEGLSLAPTREDQREYVDMGSIPGGATKSISWIIRGDKKGEYRLEAEFNGVLMPFGDEIKQIFRNDEPFRVWAGDALTMHVEAQDRADKGYPYLLRLGVENVSDISLYNVKLELLEESKQNYIFAPNQELVEIIPELKAGETVWKDYYLIPAIEGLLSLGQSYELKTGGEADINQINKSIAVPGNLPGTAPVLNQVNKPDGKVSLSWGAVDGATGYKIYRIRDDLYMSTEPELVYSCGPEVTSVELEEAQGPYDYIINTLTAKGELMLHAITGFSWIERAGRVTLTIDPEILIAGRETKILITSKKGGFPLESGRVDIGDLAKGQSLDNKGQAEIIVKPVEAGPIEVRLYSGEELLISKTIQVVFPEAPRHPNGLKVQKADRKAILTWFPNDEQEVSGYNIYQIIDNSWIKINSGLCTDTRFEVPGLKDNTRYTFQVSAVDIFTRESEPSDAVQVMLGIPEDLTAPWVIGTSPVNQEREVQLNTKLKVTFSENVSLHRSFEDIKVMVGGQNVEFELPVTQGNVLIIELKQKLPLKTHCRVTIPAGAVRDIKFNELERDYTFEFFTEVEKDSIAPLLVGVSPAENTQLVSIHSSVFLYFSEEIKEGSAYEDISLKANGSDIAFTKEIIGGKIVLKPLEALPYCSKIQIFVPEKAVGDMVGNLSVGEHTLEFYTETWPDILAPKVIRMTPSVNSRDVELNAEIKIYFSERIKIGSSYNDIALKTDDGIVAATFSINGNVLTIKPSANLVSNKLYQIVVPAGALTDMSENLLLEKFEAVFLTGEASDI